MVLLPHWHGQFIRILIGCIVIASFLYSLTVERTACSLYFTSDLNNLVTELQNISLLPRILKYISPSFLNLPSFCDFRPKYGYGKQRGHSPRQNWCQYPLGPQLKFQIPLSSPLIQLKHSISHLLQFFRNFPGPPMLDGGVPTLMTGRIVTLLSKSKHTVPQPISSDFFS